MCLVDLLLYIQSLAALFAWMRPAALEKGMILPIARAEPSHPAAIRAEPVAMLMLSVNSGGQKLINRKSQEVVDFIELIGLLYA